MAEHRSRHRAADSGSLPVSELLARLTGGSDADRPAGHRHAVLRPAFTAPALPIGSMPGFALPALAMPSLALPSMPSASTRRTMIAAVSAGALGVTAAIAATAGPAALPSASTGVHLATSPGPAAAAFSLPVSAPTADAPPAAVTGADLAASALPRAAAAPAPTVAAPAPATASPDTAAPVATAEGAAADAAENKAAEKSAAENDAAAKASKKTAAAKAAAVAAAAAAADASDTADASDDADTTTASSGSIGVRALAFAKANLGKPYRFGAVGPNAFDCSGLVMSAFKKAGMTLPRTSAAQSRVGTPVSRSQLKPGDLVFFYSPVSHVGIYVGGGMMINASTSGQPVKISSMGNRQFNSARRV